MKTLKKTLCLILAVVMVVGVLILPAYAADDYTAAITALQNYKVLQGKGDGLIHADDPVTRADMAAIVYRIMTGDTEPAATANQKAAAKYGAYADKFKDLTANDQWAKGYIGFCANQGVLKGDEKGNVKPNQQITGYEVQAMLLRALGYDRNNEYTGSNWEYKVLADATKAGISKGVSTDPANMTPRGAVAQLTYNAAINAKRVAPSVYPNVGYNLLSDSLIKVAPSKTYDDWGAPSTDYALTFTWPDTDVEDTKTVADKPLAEFYGPKTECDVATAIKQSGDKLYTTYVNGVDNKNTEATETARTISATDTTNTIGQNGRWTRVYSDRIVYVDTFLAKVTKVTEAVKDAAGHVITDASVEATVYSNSTANSLATAYTAPVTGVKVAGSFAEGDFLAVTILTDGTQAHNELTAAANIEVVDAVKLTPTTVTIDAITKNNSGTAVGFVDTNGKRYSYNYTFNYNSTVADAAANTNALLADAAIGDKWNVYVDAHGYVLALAQAADVPQYGVILSGKSVKLDAGKWYAEFTVLGADGKNFTVKTLVPAGNTPEDGDKANEPFTSEANADKYVAGSYGESDTDTSGAKHNLVTITADTTAATKGYPGYYTLTAADQIADGDTAVDIGDAETIGATPGTAATLVDDNTVFFIANYTLNNKKNGYDFKDFTVVKGFKNLPKDIEFDAQKTTVDGKASQDDLLIYAIEKASATLTSDVETATHVLILNGTKTSINKEEKVDKYAYFLRDDEFVDDYLDHFIYKAIVNGTPNTSIRVAYGAADKVTASGLYKLSDYDTNEYTTVETAGKMTANQYLYENGVLAGGSSQKKDTEAQTTFVTVAANAKVYAVNERTGACTAVSSVKAAVDTYGATGDLWYQLDKYGYADVIYVVDKLPGKGGSTIDGTNITTTIDATAGNDVFGTGAVKVTDSANKTKVVSIKWERVEGHAYVECKSNEIFVNDTQYRVTIKLATKSATDVLALNAAKLTSTMGTNVGTASGALSSVVKAANDTYVITFTAGTNT